MRKTFLPIALLLMLFAANTVQAGQGGPDAFGYIWMDSDEPGGPAFNWVDISGRPGVVTVTGLADDNSVGMFNIGWDFHFYWSDYDRIKVGSNGWISFNNVGNLASCFPTVPTAGGAGDNLVVPYMSDLIYNGTGNPAQMQYWTNNVDTFVLSCTNVPWWRQQSPGWVGSNTFQIILCGADSSITFQYLNTDQANLAIAAACPTSLEVGIENLTGNVGLNVTSGTTCPSDSQAIKFYYPASTSFQVPDITPAWAANTDNAGQFVYTNVPYTLSANLENVGNFQVSNNINVTGTIDNILNQQQWTSTAGISTGLAAGADSTVDFPTQVTLTTAGQYYFEVATSNNQDINPSNNSTVVELSAVTNTGGAVQLTYCTGAAPTNALSWAGGGVDDGVAVKMVPPGYPMTIDSISAFVLGDDGDPNTPMLNGYKLVIYGDDGTGNVDLNNILQLEQIAALDAIEDNWNRIALDSSVTVTSGSIFVAWLQGGDGVAIGSEASGPISRRSYEILGGAWSPYRDNTVNDFLIQVASILPVSNTAAFDVDPQISVYPNPTNGLATIAYNVNVLGDVRFSMLNTMGQEVWSKLHSGVAPGQYNFQVDTTPVAAGVYFLSMEVAGRKFTKKLIVE